MEALYVLRQYFRGTGTFAIKHRHVANIAMAALLYIKSVGGRSKEWRLMPRVSIGEVVAGGKDFVKTTRHKTVGTDGELGKFVPSANREAIRLYLEFPDKVGHDLFLAPAGPLSHDPDKPTTVHISQFLCRFSKVNAPDRASICGQRRNGQVARPASRERENPPLTGALSGRGGSR